MPKKKEKKIEMNDQNQNIINLNEDDEGDNEKSSKRPRKNYGQSSFNVKKRTNTNRELIKTMTPEEMQAYLNEGRKPTKLLSLMNRKRNKVSKSEKQMLVEKLYKSKIEIKDARGMRTELEKEFKDVTKDDAEYYYNIYKMKYASSRIGLIRNLVSKPVRLSYIGTIQSRYITSDKLFWSQKAAELIKTLDSEVKDFLILKKITLTTMSVNQFDEKKVFDECYFQDFAVDVSSPGWTVKNNTQAKDFEEVKKLAFTMDGINCKVYRVKNNDMVYVKGEVTLEEVIKKLNSTTYIKTKSFLSQGVKKISKKKGYYYYMQEIEPTDFCPAFLGLKDITTFTVKYDFELEPNAYVETCISQKKILQDVNLISFENLNSVMQLLQIIRISLGEDMDSQLNKEMIEFYSKYVENKNVFAQVRTHYSTFKNIVLAFYDSFVNKVNIEKIKTIYQKCVSFMAEEVQIGTDKKSNVAYAKILISLKNVGQRMINFSSSSGKDRKSVIGILTRVCVQLMDPGSESSQIEENVRAAGLLILDILMDGEYPMIDEIRSPCAFLVNTTGKEKVSSLEAKVNELLNQVRGKYLEGEELAQANAKVMLEGMKGYRDALIGNMGNLMKEINLDEKSTTYLKAFLEKAFQKSENEIKSDLEKKTYYLRSTQPQLSLPSNQI